MKYIDKNKYKDKKEEDSIKLPTDYADAFEYFRKYAEFNTNFRQRILMGKFNEKYYNSLNQ